MGIEKFRQHFAGHEGQYVLIGGAACDLLFGEAGLPFRATKDIDMVLIIEAVDAGFGTAFSKFVRSGGYKAREKGDGKKEFFRFHRPTDADYPYMIEIFSRKPDGLLLPDNMGVTRLPIEDDVISLSAILLDDDYYASIQNSKTTIDGISLLDETLLIPFKARAALDLTERKAGEKHIRKHRNDVFRLLQLLPQDRRIDMGQAILTDLALFIESVEADDTLDPQSFGVRLTKTEALQLLRSVYGLGA